MRVEWDLSSFQIPKDKIEEYFETLIASRFQMNFRHILHNIDSWPRIVAKYELRGTGNGEQGLTDLVDNVVELIIGATWTMRWRRIGILKCHVPRSHTIGTHHAIRWHGALVANVEPTALPYHCGITCTAASTAGDKKFSSFHL